MWPNGPNGVSYVDLCLRVSASARARLCLCLWGCERPWTCQYMTYINSGVDLYVGHNVSILLWVLSPIHDAVLHGVFCTCKFGWIQRLLSGFQISCPFVLPIQAASTHGP